MTNINMKEYNKIITEIKQLSIIKNNDYGCNSILRFGIRGITIRLYDKIERLITLTTKNHKQLVNDENIEDTAKDIVNYATYIILLSRDKFIKNDDT